MKLEEHKSSPSREKDPKTTLRIKQFKFNDKVKKGNAKLRKKKKSKRKKSKGKNEEKSKSNKRNSSLKKLKARVSKRITQSHLSSEK